MPKRLLTAVMGVLFFGAIIVACAPNIRVLGAKPNVPYRVLGMVNGSGPNEASAMAAIVENARNVEGANGVIMTGRKMLGKLVIVQGQAIHYTGDIPE